MQEETVKDNMEEASVTLKKDMSSIQVHALDAVKPGKAVARHMHIEGHRLRVGSHSWNVAEVNRVLILAIGKAAVPMAESAVDIMSSLSYKLHGCVVTKVDHAQHHKLPPEITIIEAGHPIPDDRGLLASEKIKSLLHATTAEDLVLLLLSGGGSALLPAPADGLTLKDLQTTTNLLLRSGANIVDMNTVRKHLSALKGGQLARLAAPAPLIGLILSDVVGDPLDVIASGPSTPDPTTFQNALDILTRYRVVEQVPEAVVNHLHHGAAECILETPKPLDPIFSHVKNIVVGSNAMAARAAAQQAKKLGYHTMLLTTYMEGEAREVGKVAGAIAKGIRFGTSGISAPACIVWGGETTVTVLGAGKGGRNQELAVAAALSMEGLGDVLLLALATDGTDGPTDAAGAYVDGHSTALARNRGWDPYAVLADNNAYPMLDDIGALLRLGPTGTNVNDILILLVG